MWTKLLCLVFLPGVLLIPRLLEDDGCLADDAAVPPDCLNVNERTYFPHPFNCSRFWECEPSKAHCLMECPATETGELYFNPDLNVCDWPDNVDCSNTEPCNCLPWQTCQEGVCTPECAADTDCSGEDVCDQGSCVQCSTGSCGKCGECVNHECVEPDCCSDNDCQGSGVCTAGECVQECTANSDCGPGELCTAGSCVPGCTEDSTCPGCAPCVNGQCEEPECCQDKDCTDPSKPICSADHTCTANSDGACQKTEDCEGYDGVCDADLSNCSYCDIIDQVCKPGCTDSNNCDGFHCGVDHTCKPGLLSIVLDTQSCTGCQGSQGIKDEDGPFLILEGSSGASCNTRQLDHPNQIDFDNGKSAEFSDEVILQTCYKADLTSVTKGTLRWTASQGLWAPKNKQIKLRWSGSTDLVCCCLSRADLSSTNPAASLTSCSDCSTSPSC